MAFKVILYIIGALSLLASTGCAPNAVSTTAASKLNGTSNPVASAQPLTAVQLNGNWKSSCDVDTASGTSALDLVSFSGNQMTVTTTEYMNANCNAPIDFTTQIVSTYTLNGWSSVPNATAMTETITQIIMTASTPSAVADNNATAFCGSTNWQLNVPKTILLTNPCLQGLNNPHQDIMSVVESTLYFGNESQTAIDTSFGYFKQ